MLKTFIAIMAIFVLGINANAADESSFKIEFLTGSNASTQLKTTDAVSSVVTDASKPYVTGNFTKASTSYAKATNGLRLSSGKNPGSVAFNLSTSATHTITKLRSRLVDTPLQKQQHWP